MHIKTAIQNVSGQRHAHQSLSVLIHLEPPFSHGISRQNAGSLADQ